MGLTLHPGGVGLNMRGHGDSQRFYEAEAIVNICVSRAGNHGFAPKAFASKGFLVYPCYDLSGLANHVRPPSSPSFVPGSSHVRRPDLSCRRQ